MISTVGSINPKATIKKDYQAEPIFMNEQHGSKDAATVELREDQWSVLSTPPLHNGNNVPRSRIDEGDLLVNNNEAGIAELRRQSTYAAWHWAKLHRFGHNAANRNREAATVYGRRGIVGKNFAQLDLLLHR
jgi:hypothetical protein